MLLHEQDTVGFQVLNSILCNTTEDVDELSSDLKDNVYASTAFINEPNRVYKVQLDTSSGNIHPDQTITVELDTDYTHVTNSGVVTTLYPVNTYSYRDFFSAPPNRISQKDSDNVEPAGLDGQITGITYVRDWSKVNSSGIVLIPKQDVYMVNQNLSSPVDAAIKNTVLYNSGWTYLDNFDYGSGFQSYTDNGYYEVMENASGIHTFEHVPISGSIEVYDYINLDPSGSSQLLPTGQYVVDYGITDYKTWATVSVSGTNPWTGLDVRHSNYYTQYKYKKFEYPMAITTPAARWSNQVHAGTPVMTSYPAHYNGTVVPFSIARSISGTTAALSADVMDLRPGSNVTVKFKYVNFIDTSWSNDTTFELDVMAADSNFVNTASGGLHIYAGLDDISTWFTPYLQGSTILSADVVAGLPWDTPYRVRCYYNAAKTYSDITAVQSFGTVKTDADQYPMDYSIDGGYL